MLDYKDEIADLLTRMKKYYDSVNKQLNMMPEGRLVYRKIRNEFRPVNDNYTDESRTRKIISEKSDEYKALINKVVLSERAENLAKDIALLEYIFEKMKGDSTYASVNRIMKLINAPDDSEIIKALRSDPPGTWSGEKYEKLHYPGDDIKTNWHITSFGLKVRSKSELLIAELLKKYNLEFRYEQMLYYGNISLAPDFTIKRADGKLIYWEHEGLTNSRKYLDRQINKHINYAKLGIVPWDNFIVTYDNSDGVIDLRIAEAELRNKLII